MRVLSDLYECSFGNLLSPFPRTKTSFWSFFNVQPITTCSHTFLIHNGGESWKRATWMVKASQKNLHDQPHLYRKEIANLQSQLIAVPHSTPLLSKVTVRVFQFFVSCFGKALICRRSFRACQMAFRNGETSETIISPSSNGILSTTKMAAVNEDHEQKVGLDSHIYRECAWGLVFANTVIKSLTFTNGVSMQPDNPNQNQITTFNAYTRSIVDVCGTKVMKRDLVPHTSNTDETLTARPGPTGGVSRDAKLKERRPRP